MVVASRLLDDCFLKAVVVDGTDVLTVSHLGRTIPARFRTAVEEMHPECDIEGCHVTTGPQIDHNQPVEEFGKTELVQPRAALSPPSPPQAPPPTATRRSARPQVVRPFPDSRCDLLTRRGKINSMEAVRPVGWADVATKQDLLESEARMDSRFTSRVESLAARFATLETRMGKVEDKLGDISRELRAQTWKLAAWTIAVRRAVVAALRL